VPMLVNGTNLKSTTHTV